ncbi:hypothetical protein NMY22_g19310 [Coprinellus aureogranulatus]|nr:hypothetical protein NMY22_g19310 [Coprinellus aureogranulatus]
MLSHAKLSTTSTSSRTPILVHKAAAEHKKTLVSEFDALRRTPSSAAGDRRHIDERLVRIANNLKCYEFDLDPHFAASEGIDAFWEDPLSFKIVLSLQAGASYPGDDALLSENPLLSSERWEVRNVPRGYDERSYEISDHLQGFRCRLPAKNAANPKFRIAEWYAERLRAFTGFVRRWDEPRTRVHLNLGDLSAQRVERILNAFLPCMTDRKYNRAKHFECRRILTKSGQLTRSFALRDLELNYSWKVHESIVTNTKVDWLSWYWVNRAKTELSFTRSGLSPLPSTWECDSDGYDSDSDDDVPDLLVYTIGEEPQSLPALQRNSARRKVVIRSVPKPIVIVVEIDGHPTRALLDTGSLGDFMSTSLVSQLKLKRTEMETPIQVQLAVQGSRTKVNYRVEPQFRYQGIDTKKSFDVINIEGYDLILGTPFLFQHKVCIGLNPTRVIIGSDAPMPLKGDGLAKLESRAMTAYQDNIAEVRQHLVEYARPLCKNASETPLPPLREMNHRIPLIDPTKRYSWRASKCPEPLLPLWNEKRNDYIKTGRWEPSTSFNASPLLCLKKAGKPGEPLRLRTVVDLRERNANTHKLAAPLPDMDGILRRLARARYRSIIDGQDAYEQIRVEPEDVPKTAMNTPNGNMVSLVMQQGDTNAVATFQTIMTRLFAPYIGKFVDVYLDDIVIYSNTLREHIEHVKLVIDILRRGKFFLSEKKLRFLCSEMKVLGRIVDDEGIRMDPDKVDSLSKWKTPINRDLLRGFLGAAGYLADDIDRVRIPMGILHSLTADGVPFRWTHTHQRAFEEIKSLAVRCRDHHRKPLVYGADAPPVNLVTDGCVTGIAGVISQGKDWKTANVAAFFSAKLNSAQQNYAVHEIELLAGIESMLRYRDILQGVHFRWYTDHKGLTHFLEQRN